MILTLLSLINLGLYFPAPYAPLGTWFNVSIPMFSINDKLSISAGYSNEPVIRSYEALGGNWTQLVGKNAWFLSGTKSINSDLNFDAGIKYLENTVSPFAAISFKFGTLIGGC